MSIDPTDAGIPINAPATEGVYSDVFDFVMKKLAEEKPGQILMASDFIAKARELFTENAPIALDFLGSNLGLRFQDGTALTFCDVDTGMSGVGGNDGSMAVTPDKRPRGGKGSTVATPTWGMNEPQQ